MNVSIDTSSDVTTLSSLFQFNAPQCLRNVTPTCTPLHENTTCFGSHLPHNSTSFVLVTDAKNLQEAKEKLLLWSGLRAVPKCWDVIQPLLCSVYYPSCENGKVQLLDRSICQDTRGPCKIVDTEYGWPDFLQCDNNDVFEDGCRKTEVKFNTSDCEAPLISTNNPASYYDEVEGCGLQCMNPLFNQDEHDEIHSFIAGWAASACICIIFAMLSFFIDWKNSSKYPARIIFYINLCFFIGGIGWLAQFFPGARDEIVCRKDGTKRLGEPVGHDESPSCVIIFVLVYFFLMAGITWFDILCYSWYLMFKALGTYKDPLIGKAKIFHITAWSIPFILMVVCLSVTEIDGDSMSGICFIGYKNYFYRLCLLLIPVGIVLLIGGFFIFRGFVTLVSIRKGHPGLLSESAVSKINWTMIRIGIFAVLAFIFVFVTFAAHLYDYTNQALWEKSFRGYIKCQANVTILEQLSGLPPKACVLENHPNLSIIKLNIVALFGTGIVMSTWVWTKSSAENWRRAWYKLIGRSDNETKRIRHKSKIIAKAFAMRNILKNRHKKNEYSDDDDHRSDLSELEYSEHTMSHQDPVGMNFDLHSVSREMSSTWMRNIPKMVERRGGILPEGKLSTKGSRDARAKKSNRITAKVTDVEPGLWAVSQYIHGSDMKTKTDKGKVVRKTGPANNLNSVFIGTSPYNYPVNQRPPLVPHGDSEAQRTNPIYTHPHGCVERTRHGNILHLDTQILPGMLHGDVQNWPCFPPGHDETNYCSPVFQAASYTAGQDNYYERVNPGVKSCEHACDKDCDFLNSNNNGNRVHYFTSPNHSISNQPRSPLEPGAHISLASSKSTRSNSLSNKS